jgi:orotidine-5'-phosphate decarboxylase
VCSPLELSQIRSVAIKKICPGVRPAWYQGQDDQHRAATPAEAIANGADFLVIGRPLLNAKDMVATIRQTNAEIAGA